MKLAAKKQSPSLADAFKDQGYAYVPAFLSVQWITRIADELNWIVTTQLNRFADATISRHADPITRLSDNLIQLDSREPQAQAWIYDEVNRMPVMHELAASTLLMDMAKAVSDSHHLAIHPRLNMIISMPGESWHVARWHQDGFYAPHTHVVTYIPLLATGAHNGGLTIAPRQHAKLLTHQKQLEDSKWITLTDETVESFDEVIQLELGAGDLVLFDRHLPHTAKVNHSDHVRFALTIRYSNLEDPFFIERGWQWKDLAEEGLQALQDKPKDAGRS